jgi:hypothetical protein
MENKFKLKKPLPQSWGVYNDGSKEFREWVLGYLSFNGYNYLAVPKGNGYVFGFSNEDKYTFPAVNKMFDTILTLDEFKSYFETENEWREASEEYVGYVKFKMMELSDDKKDIIKLFVLYEMDGLFYGNYPIYRISEGNLNTYKYARELAEQALNDNKQLFNEYFGIDE